MKSADDHRSLRARRGGVSARPAAATVPRGRGEGARMRARACALVPALALAILVAGAGAALAAGAQGGPPVQGPSGPPPDAFGPPGGPPGGPPDDDLRETITLLMMVRMKRELALSDKQYEQILPKVQEFEQTRAASFRERRSLDEQLRALLGREGVKDSEYTELVNRMASLDEADRKAEAAHLAELRRVLTPRQQAQLIVFRMQFRQWIESRMRDARQLRGQGPGPGGQGRGAGRGAGPGALDDDSAPGPR